MFYIVLFAIIAIILLFYYYGTKNHKYWKQKGVTHDKPIPFFGNSIRQVLMKISMADFYAELYNKYPEERIVGFYEANQIGVIVRDPELVKDILITDFHAFYERGFNLPKGSKYVESMMRNLFFVEGDLWKLLRQRFTPAFTSGKLKAMFPLIVERAKKLQDVASEAAQSGKDVDVRDLMARYTTDFIGACGFGIDSDSLNDENSTFRKLGKRIFQVTPRDFVVWFVKVIAPNLFSRINFLPDEIERDTVSLLRAVMADRNYKPSGRNDFIDILLELKQKGKMIGESVEKRKLDGTPEIVEEVLDELLMAAQVFIFFAAGFETSSSATSFTLHQLAFHPEEQKKCQDEIDKVLIRYNNELCYDAVKEMKYLNWAFMESMRMFPSLGFLKRMSTKPYKFVGTDVTIDKYVDIIIPINALQNDPKYFEEPETFKPERFHPDSVNEIKKHVYLPFGEGPRACVGERLGQMQSLAGLAAVLSKFTVVPSNNTLRYPVTDPTSTVTQAIKGGLPLTLVARKKVF